MAASDSNSVAAQAANPFGNDHHPPVSCLDDPNFATICSFIQNFGEIVRIGHVPFDELQQWLENTSDVPPPLVQLHITLLRRVFKTVSLDKWERSLAKFGHTYCSQDAWEVERFGYKKAKIQTKLRLLKNLLEAQFDYNVKFKAEVNKLPAADLRLTPLGRDTEGQLYWYQVDDDANLRVYREDIDDETWEIVASDRDELENLISQLQRGEVRKPEPEGAIIVPEEDSNSKDDIEPREIILDTGKVEEEEESGESEEEEANKETRTVQPLILKHAFNIDKAHCKEVGKVDSDVVDKSGSNTESEPKVPKLVLGLKPKPKVENDLPNKTEPQVDIPPPLPPSEDVTTSVPAPDVVMEEDCNAVDLPMPKSLDAVPVPPPQVISKLKTEPIEEPAQQDVIQVVKKVENRDTTVITEDNGTKITEQSPLPIADPKPAKVRISDVGSDISASVGQREQIHAKSSKNIVKSQKDVLQMDKKVESSNVTLTAKAKDPQHELTKPSKPIADPKPAKVSSISDVIGEISASGGQREPSHARSSRNIIKSQKDEERLFEKVDKKVESSKVTITAKDPQHKLTEPSKPIAAADPKPAKVSSISDVIGEKSASAGQREQSHAKSSRNITKSQEDKVESSKVTTTAKDPENKITDPSKPVADHKPGNVSSISSDTITEISASAKQREQSHAKLSMNIKSQEYKQVESPDKSVKDLDNKITEPSKPIAFADPKPAKASSISDIIGEISASARQRDQSHAKSSRNITKFQDDNKVDSGDVTVKDTEPKITELSKHIIEPKSSKVSSISDVISEISASVEQREQSHAKSSKNIKKSAKVNSIVERLNRNLPEVSTKSVHDCFSSPASEKVDSRSSVVAALDQGLDLSFTKTSKSKSSIREKVESKSSLVAAMDQGLNLTVAPKTSSTPPKISTTEKESKSLARVLESLQTKDNTRQIAEEAKKQSETKAALALTIEQPDKKKESVEFKSSSITRQPKLSNSPLFKNEDTTTADKLADFASSSGLVRDSNIISKDNGTVVPEPQDVPITVQESSVLKPPSRPVEETVQKTKTWVCGDTKSQPVTEKVVVKEKTWVCGNESQPVAEKAVVKESTWVCGAVNKEPVSNILDPSNNQSRIEKSVKISHNKPDTQLVAPQSLVKPSKETTPKLQNFSASSHSSLSAPKERISLPVNKQSDIETPASVHVINQESKSVPYGLSDNPQSKVEKESLSVTGEKKTAGAECIENVGQSAVSPTPLVKEDSNSKPVVSVDPIPSISNEESERKVKPVVVEEPTVKPSAKESNVEVKSSVEHRPEDMSKNKSMAQTKSTPLEESPAPLVIQEKSDIGNIAVTSESQQKDPIPEATKEIKRVTTRDESLNLASEKNIEATVQIAFCKPPPELSMEKIMVSDSKVSAVVCPPAEKIATEVETKTKVSPPVGEIKSPATEASLTKSQTERGVKAVTLDASKPEDTKQKDSTDTDTPKLKEKVVGESKAVPKNHSAGPSAQDKSETEEPGSTSAIAISNDVSDINASTTPVKSSLVSCLYSDSSESSNEAFPNSSEKVNTPRDSVTDQSTTETESSGIVSFSAEIRKQDSSTSSNSVSKNLERKEGTNNDSSTSGPSRDPLKETGESKKSDEQSIASSNSVTEIASSVRPDSLNGSSVSSGGNKRKADEEIESLSKIPKIDELATASQKETSVDLSQPVATGNPIVGEAVEEEVMTISGEGSGAMNEGGNEREVVPFNPICGETIEEEIMTIIGEGFGVMNQGSNENSPVSLAIQDMPGSQDESNESDVSREASQSSRGRGGRRGRGRGRGRGRPPGTPNEGRKSQGTPSSTPRSRGSREVARLGVSVDSVELNGENERPVRASRRIAQIRQKEEEERRQLEEERLAQLKAAQMRKKAKLDESKGEDVQSPGLKVKKGKGRKSQKDQVQYVQDYVPSGSESAENSDDEAEGSDEYSGKVGKGKIRKKRKNGKAKKGGNPWATSSDDDDEEQVEEEEEYHYEEEEEELVFKSDHEFSPESDVEENEDIVPSRHARTAKQDKGDLFEEGNCNRCRKGDHPEWILLCDKCDKGWHASCLRPQLWVVPEGEWFCPPCQHNMLIENLSKNLVEYEGLLKRKENDILRKQRLAYVGISLDNVLPDKEPEPEIPELEAELYEKIERDRDREKRRSRRRILSDEELSDDFINDGDSNEVSRSRSGSSGSDSEDEPVYRLRQRRTKKAFDFKEYDDMINSALRVDDDDEEEEVEEVGGKGKGKDIGQDDEEDENEDQQLNGEEKESPEDMGGGKNEAYFKHLEKQAQEEEETDEELLDEKERLRRKELKKQGQRKTKRRINDLDAYSEDEDSDDDFKASEEEDDEEALAEEGESEWSGDKMEDDSDDSIAKRARTKDRHGGRRGRLGRKEKYSDKGLVRRSTRKRRSRISYDESDEDEEEDQADKWQSDEESEAEETESNSESDDSTYGKKKKKGGFAAKPKMPNFVLGASSTKGKGKGGVKRKKRRIDDDDVDKAWNSARGKKEKDEPIERRTRGRKINFKDILDSGESDDDGNVRPKRRPLSDSDDSRSPSSSRKLAEEIRAENARKEKEYEELKAKMGGAVTPTHTQSEIPDETKEVEKINAVPTMPEAHSVAKLAESSVKKTPVASPLPEISQPLAAIPLTVHSKVSAASPPPISSPAHLSAAVLSPSSIHIPASVSSMVMPVITSPPMIPPNSSPLLHSTLSASILPATLVGMSTSPKQSSPIPSMLPKSPPPIPFIPKSTPPMILVGSPHKSNSPVVPPPPLPVPPLIEKKSSKKGSRGSRGSKSEQPLIASPPPSDLEIALTKPVKSSPHGATSSSKSSSKKRDRERDRESTLTVPNPSLLMAGVGGVIPELLGASLAASIRPGIQGLPIPPTERSSTKRGKSSGSSSSRTTQQTTPPPVPQNLNPSLPIDIDRVPNPALFQNNPGLRSPFHPMWGVKNPGPPTGYNPPGSQMPTSLGKPPPLNTSPFGQQGPPSRPGFPSPPPLRIPNPNTSPLQAFQHFKRDSALGGPLYRLPPGQPQPGVPLPNILPPGMMSPHSGGPERFFGAPPGYPHPYGLLPPHSQGPPQALFPYDYRPPEPPFKEEPVPPPPRTTSSSIPTPVSSSSSSPPPTMSAPVSLTAKDEGASEFGGLVSYFSSQRSEEDMDS